MDNFFDMIYAPFALNGYLIGLFKYLYTQGSSFINF